MEVASRLRITKPGAGTDAELLAGTGGSLVGLQQEVAQKETQQEPVISMSPLDFAQELLGSSYHTTLRAYQCPPAFVRDYLHFWCPNTSHMPMLGLLAQLVLLPTEEGTASWPSKPLAAGLGYSTMCSFRDSEVLKASWFCKPSKPSPHKTRCVCSLKYSVKI